MNNNKNLKVFVLSLGLGVAMLSTTVQAQGVFGNMHYNHEEQNQANRGALMRGGSGSDTYSIATEQFGNGTSGAYDISTEQFGQNAPLGSGLFIMAAAGAAYALKKRKMNK